MPSSRRIRFSNPTRLLCETDRLSALRERVDDIAAGLSELEAMSEDERRDAVELRDSVLHQFKTLGDA